jgi:hypothetical protein
MLLSGGSNNSVARDDTAEAAIGHCTRARDRVALSADKLYRLVF